MHRPYFILPILRGIPLKSIELGQQVLVLRNATLVELRETDYPLFINNEDSPLWNAVRAERVIHFANFPMGEEI